MKKVLIFATIVVFVLAGIGCTLSATDNKNEGLAQSVSSNSPIEGKTHAPETTVVPANTPRAETIAYEIVYNSCNVYQSSLGYSRACVIIQIENTGSETLYLDTKSIDLEDASGKLVDVVNLASFYPDVLQPGETALLVEDVSLDEDPGVDELNIVPHLNISKATIECIRYETSDEELFESQYYGLKMRGRVKNTSAESDSMVYVVVNLYDANHHGIGQLYTIITDKLEPNEKVGFEMSSLIASDSLTLDSVVSYEVFAYPHQYQFDW